MSSTRPKILFISHSASRNGASILLLHFLQWMRQHTDCELDILCCGGGPLIDGYRAVARTRILRNPARFLRFLPFRWAAIAQSTVESSVLRLLLLRSRHDLVYVNTAATWRQAAYFASRRVPLLWHIHELTYALRHSFGDCEADKIFPQVDRFIAVSQSVANALQSEFSVPAKRIASIHGFVTERGATPEAHRESRERIRDSLGWPRSAFVVGGCGALGWRKGTDLFLQIARLLVRTRPDAELRFLWVGGRAADSEEGLQFAHEAAALRVAHLCTRVPATTDVHEYYCAMDVFALPSREDPFPLVMLEAGNQGVPTVCFSDSGGGEEFVGTDAGLVAPLGDSAAFAGALLKLFDAPETRLRLGEGARAKVHSCFSVETQGPLLSQAIEDCLAHVRR